MPCMHIPPLSQFSIETGYTYSATYRLRVSLSAAHTAEDVQRLAAAIQECNLHFLPIDQVLSSAKQGDAMATCKL